MRRTIVSAVGAVMAAAAALFLLYFSSSDVRIEMDGPPPGFATGLYPSERDGDTSFAWTSDRLILRLDGLDRGVDWICTIRIRGARDASMQMPSIRLHADDIAHAPLLLSNEYQELAIAVPAAAGSAGLTLTAEIGPTFVPGGADRRELGAQVDWIRCDAEDRAAPPIDALRAGALFTGAIGLAVAVSGLPMVFMAAVAVVAAVGVTLLLSAGNGAFGTYPTVVTWIGVLAAMLLAAVTVSPRLAGRRRLSTPALMAATATAVLAALELAALTHPAKALVDAVFQAHRLESVLAGHYFFTQPLPDGVAFPYAIGLYVAAMPLAGIITDHVLLLRTVVVIASALAGSLLYLLAARRFDAPVAGVVAVVLFHLVPLPYVVVGNANLTNAFAQAVALAAIASIAFVPLPAGSQRGLAGLAIVTALTSAAFLSHVSTVALLAAAIGLIAVVMFVGERRSRVLALPLVGVIVVSSVVAVGLYYRHFGEVYDRAMERVFASAPEAAADPPMSTGIDAGTPAVLVRQLTWTERASDTVRQTVGQIGWPILLLAVVGAAFVIRRPRDRQALLVIGWSSAWVLCLLGGTMTRVDTEYQRYAAEFIGRVNLAYYPVAALLAGFGAGWLWRTGAIGRIVAIALVGAAVTLGATSWLGWFS